MGSASRPRQRAGVCTSIASSKKWCLDQDAGRHPPLGKNNVSFYHCYRYTPNVPLEGQGFSFRIPEDRRNIEKCPTSTRPPWLRTHSPRERYAILSLSLPFPRRPRRPWLTRKHPDDLSQSDALSMDGDRPAVKAKPRMERNRVLVTGGAGFVGSHLCEYLVKRGDHVICVDNLFTGSKDNIAHLLKEPNFELIRHDVVEPILLEIDQVRGVASSCPFRRAESPRPTRAPTVHSPELPRKPTTTGLPLGLPCQPGPLQVQPDQDDEDGVHRHDEHAGPCQALQG